jgi:hypothetical protein
MSYPEEKPRYFKQGLSSDGGTHRTRKALRAKSWRCRFGFARSFGVRTRPRVAFLLDMRNCL